MRRLGIGKFVFTSSLLDENLKTRGVQSIDYKNKTLIFQLDQRNQLSLQALNGSQQPLSVFNYNDPLDYYYEDEVFNRVTEDSSEEMSLKPNKKIKENHPIFNFIQQNIEQT